MAIRFRVPDDPGALIAFAYSPLLEAALSLHVLVEPKHHPLQHPWVRRMRNVDASLRRAIRGFSFLYRVTLADLFLPSGSDEFLDFDAELERLLELDERTLAYELTRPLYDHGGAEPREARLDDSDVRAAILENARLLGAETERLVPLVFDDPGELARRLVEMLRRYWDAGWAEEWRRLEPQLAEAVTTSGREIAERGLFSFLVGLSPRLRIEPHRREFGIDVPHDHVVELGADDVLVMVPSLYVWPHVRVNCDAPWPLALVYPAPFVRRAVRPDLPSDQLLRALRAVAESTRLRVLRLVAERPRSTQELAPLVGMSEAGLSKHLRLLADAGLLSSRREGYYVLYELVPERVRAVGAALPAMLDLGEE